MPTHRAGRPARVGLAIAALGLALLVCEMWLRLSGYRPALTDRDMYIANDSSILPYKLRPGYRGVYLGQEVEIDEHGQRVMQPQTEKRPDGGAGRIVLLVGDSIVFGHGLASDATLGAQLQNALWAKGRRDEVRSIGVAGYGSWNEYAAVGEYLRRADADIVVVVYVANDVSYDDDQLGIGKGAYATRGEDSFHRLTQVLYRHVYIAYFTVDRMRALAQGAAYEPRRARQIGRGDGALAHSLAGLAQLRDLCRSRGITLLIGIYRDVWHYDDPAGSSRYEESVADGLRASGIRFFTLRSHIDHLDRAAAQRAWNDPHPSAGAVQFLAQDLLVELDRVPVPSPGQAQAEN